VAQAGQLYILDLGPAVGGYFADNARTFAVDRRPTDVQQKAWGAIVGCLKLVEELARPGVACRALVEAVDAHLATTLDKSLPHHLGHGVGLSAHEYPHLNPHWEDVLMEGEVFTAEPGVYGPELAGGIRLENQYRVTADGVENLVSFPLEL
jgi:Xaa-Pro aminopeptidase